jgi:MarR family 2-MHQ and catechol resistance regulon transcriptional repressor
MTATKKLKATLPAISRPAEGTFRELLRVLGLLERVMQPYFAQFGISGSQWGILRNLHRAEQDGLPGLRLTDLSERLLIRPPSVTGVVDRLERASLVVRDGSPFDMRAKQVALTAKGRELVERILAVHGRQIDTVLGVLSAVEQTELHRLLSLLERHLENVLAQGTIANIG